jgi:nucleoside-diphosphate-sugar epimerase
MLSPKSQFAGKTVLLTGALGFLGSTVLEKLLRETEVTGKTCNGLVP